jgi:predicted RNase H-like HicB family nuclease
VVSVERIFEAETREEAKRKADEWWSEAKGVRFIHRSQIPPGFRSNASNQWVVAIQYKGEEAPS